MHDLTNTFKALSDQNRLDILSMLKDGEICACEILEKLNITQPTLSHHMKILLGVNLVCARKDGKWVHYSQSNDNSILNKIKDLI
jgi:ArsR family transcriptional regulator, arsenate/arsenite/antimonite-responsive transcriptional repressor